MLGLLSWIGLSNARSVPDFVWITDESAPLPVPHEYPWSPFEPTDPTDENCVVLDVTRTNLRDTECVVAVPYICECDAFPENPQHF